MHCIICAFCKSYFNPVDSQNITHDEEYMMVKGEFDRLGEKEIISCGVKKGTKKVFKRNEKAYSRLMDHIGRFPAVIIAPDDAELIHGGSELRRRWLDMVISQYDNLYLEALVNIIKRLPKEIIYLSISSKIVGGIQKMIEPWNVKMTPLAVMIAEARRDFVARFTPVFNEVYKEISGGAEEVSFEYSTSVEGTVEDFASQLARAEEIDKRLRRSTVGVHKDDLVFKIREYPLKKFGSQGQQKTYLVALRLAQLAFLEEATGVKPILLLDDILIKLMRRGLRH